MIMLTHHTQTMKAVLRWKFIAQSALVKKLERSYTNNLTAHLRVLLQKESNSLKRSRRQEIDKLRAEINQIDTNKTIQTISKTKSWLFEIINKLDKPLVKLTKVSRGRIQINKLKNENDITTEMEEIKKKSWDPTIKVYTQNDITTETEEIKKKIMRSYY